MGFGWISAAPPGEFEKQSALLLGLTDLIECSPRTVVDIVGALIDHIPLVGIVEGEEQRLQMLGLLCDWGLPAHQMYFVFMPTGIWVRDFGPSFVRWSDGRIALLDAEYGQTEEDPNGNFATRALAGLLRLPQLQVPLVIDGGHIITNGKGLCVCTSRLYERNASRGYNADRVRSVLWEWYGYGEFATLRPLVGEHSGHADMFVTFTAPDVVVVGQMDPAVDRVNAEILDENARRLASLRTRSGPMRVVRIPMPPHHDDVWPTYANVMFANGRLLVPNYPEVDRELEQQAMDTYAELLPGWKIIGIDSTDLIRSRGALHCMSLNIPWMDDRFTLRHPTYIPSRVAAR